MLLHAAVMWLLLFSFLLSSLRRAGTAATGSRLVMGGDSGIRACVHMLLLGAGNVWWRCIQPLPGVRKRDAACLFGIWACEEFRMTCLRSLGPRCVACVLCPFQ